MTTMVGALALKSTLCLLAGFAAAGLMARASAALRHWVWRLTLGALIALPLAMAMLPPLAVPVHQLAAAPPVATHGATSPLPAAAAASTAAAKLMPSAPPARDLPLGDMLAAIWLLGTLAFTARLAADCLAMRRLARAAEPTDAAELAALAARLELSRRVRLAVSPRVDVPQAGGILRPSILLPRAAATWSQERRNVVLLHELAHVRRRDCGWQALARLAAALYWWNPLTSVAARQLRLAGEQAADAEALAAAQADGVPAHEYAAHLVAIARTLVPGREPLPLAAAMARGTQIESRVQAVLSMRRPPRWTAAAGVPGLLLFAGAMAALAAARPAQTPMQLPSFEAASVKPGPVLPPGEHSSEHSDPVHLRMLGNVHRLIIRAYGITDNQITGEPDWFKSELFSVDAVTAAPTSTDQMMLMLRRLLAERFQLQMREQARNVPGYALEIAPGGVKFRELKPGERPSDPPEPEGTFARSFTSTTALVNSLNGVYGGRLHTDRPVVDRTGLTGNYWMVLQTELDRQPGVPGIRGMSFPNLAHDLEAQLGLRLVPEKIPMPEYVVVSAARPSAN